MQPRHVRYVWHAGKGGGAPPAAIAWWIDAHDAADAPAVVALVGACNADRTPTPPPAEALAVLGDRIDDTPLASTMRTGADDLVTLDQPEADWQRRLTGLADLAVLRHAVRERRAAARDFFNRDPSSRGEEPARAAVLFVGAPGPHKLAVVDALLGWSIAAYAETTAQARLHLESGRFAAVVLAGPLDAGRLERDLRPLLACSGPGTPSFVVVRAENAAFTVQDAHSLGACEVVDPSLPRDLIQRRLARAIHEAELRLELRYERAFEDAVDCVSGCIGHSGAHAFLEATLRKPHLAAHGALIALTLDGLDTINREAGFAAGDRAIRAAAEAVVGAVRAEDLVSRLDGSSFGVWIASVTDADLPGIAQRLQSVVRAAWLGDAGPGLSARTGWTRPVLGDDALTLSRRARVEAGRTLLRAVC